MKSLLAIQNVVLVTCCSLLITSCVAETVIQEVPTADAGENQLVKTGSIVYLDGGNSYDPAGRALNYQWAVLSAPVLVQTETLLDDNTISNPQFVAEYEGEYVFALRVQASNAISPIDSVTIVVREQITDNNYPIADAGNDQKACEGETVMLTGARSFDPDPTDSIDGYSWMQLDNGAPTVTLSNPSSVSTSFIPATSYSEPYQFRLIVTDGELADSDDISVYVQKIVARTSIIPTSVNASDTFELNGSASCFPSGASPVYSWKQEKQSTEEVDVSLFNIDSIIASGIAPSGVDGTFEFSLMVTADGNSDKDSSTLTVSQ